ncbi:MAG TPA: non-ribosomal peptide synthetase, partial [Longimicrobiaceae bacterium]
RVGLCLERGPEMMIAVLGILKAGAAYVPLDPAYPTERLAYMLEDSAARVLLTQASLAERLPAGEARVVRVDADAAEIARESAERPRVPVAPDHLAYVIYTSGSTGRPKGVAMPHRPLVNLLAWQEGDWRVPAAAVTLQFATISFDASFHEIFSCWMAGGQVVLIAEELRYDPTGLLEVMERAGVERLFMPAVALQHLAEVADARGVVPSRLREVQTAGEQLRVTEPMRRWLGALGAPLHNHYGPSETHVVTALALEGDPAGWPLLPAIGGPIANTQCYVLDARLQPAPIGIPGELYLGGRTLARGYLGRPELTAERFVPDPFGGEPGGRLYRTGDLARFGEDGTLAFLGRADEQVKVRGFRIEPGEVVAALALDAEVKESAVVVEERGHGEKQLVAYWVPAGDAAPDAAGLRARLAERLPEYLLPGAWVALRAMPLTAAGKVDRARLATAPRIEVERPFVAPSTPLQAEVAEVWAAVMGRERASMDDDFFVLGGHSLLATQLTSRLRRRFAIELPVGAIFDAPVVADLAREVEARVAARGERPEADEEIAAEPREAARMSAAELEALLD